VLLLGTSCGRSALVPRDDDGNVTFLDQGFVGRDVSTADQPRILDGPQIPVDGPQILPDKGLPPDAKIKPDMGPRPDLVIKNFTAKANGADIEYSYEVCNVGTAKVSALFFRVDLYYKSLLAPLPMIPGDTSTTHWGALAPGSCAKTTKKTYKNAPVGLYRSYVRADTLNNVKESNEGNNTSGPQTLTVSPPSSCYTMCIFAIGCGKFQIVEYGNCLTWCKGLSSTEYKCAENARDKVSCSDFNKCNLPAKPTLPTILTCWDVCNYLINTCKLIPSNQQLTCNVGCFVLPYTKKTCALNAMNKKLCTSMMLCLL